MEPFKWLVVGLALIVTCVADETTEGTSMKETNSSDKAFPEVGSLSPSNLEQPVDLIEDLQSHDIAERIAFPLSTGTILHHDTWPEDLGFRNQLLSSQYLKYDHFPFPSPIRDYNLKRKINPYSTSQKARPSDSFISVKRRRGKANGDDDIKTAILEGLRSAKDFVRDGRRRNNQRVSQIEGVYSKPEDGSDRNYRFRDGSIRKSRRRPEEIERFLSLNGLQYGDSYRLRSLHNSYVPELPFLMPPERYRSDRRRLAASDWYDVLSRGPTQSFFKEENDALTELLRRQEPNSVMKERQYEPVPKVQYRQSNGTNIDEEIKPATSVSNESDEGEGSLKRRRSVDPVLMRTARSPQWFFGQPREKSENYRSESKKNIFGNLGILGIPLFTSGLKYRKAKEEDRVVTDNGEPLPPIIAPPPPPPVAIQAAGPPMVIPEMGGIIQPGMLPSPYLPFPGQPQVSQGYPGFMGPFPGAPPPAIPPVPQQIGLAGGGNSGPIESFPETQNGMAPGK